MHRRLKQFFQFSYCIILLSGSLSATLIPKSTDTSIAAYDRYVTPVLKTTKYFDPQYAYRFHPDDNSYITHKTLHKHLTITRYRTNPKYHLIARATQNDKIKLINQQKLIARNVRLQRHNKQKELRHKPSLLQRIFHLKTKKQQEQHLLNKDQRELSSAQQKLQNTPAQTKSHHMKRFIYNKTLPPHYHIAKDTGHKIVYLYANYPIWSKPYRPALRYTSSTNRLAHDDQAMIILKKAVFRQHVFYLLESSNNTYGWVPREAIRTAHTYMLPFQYYSQLYPTYAPDACEVVALRMALSVKGYDPNISMKRYIDRVPRNHDPEKGYNASPFKMGDNASIYPKALAKYGRRYDKNVSAFTGITEHRVISEIEHGNPVVFEGAYRMRVLDSDHTLVLIGYSHGDLEFADPFCRKSDLINNKPISWVSMSKFERMFHQSFRGARAVVIH